VTRGLAVKGRFGVQMVLLAVGALAVPAGVLGLRPIQVPAGELRESSAPALALPAPIPLDSLTAIVVEGDLFRISREPAELPYQLTPPDPLPAEMPPPKPQLLLSGIVWGDEPNALVEGLPGVDGVQVLRAGESSGAIRVKRITRTEVTLVGMDTTWVLQVRKPW
jgi:hypothetical protein